MEIIIIIVVNSLSPLRCCWGRHFPFFLFRCLEYEWEILNVSGKYWIWVRNHERELLDTSGKYWIQNIHIQRWWSSLFVFSRCLEYEREILEVFNERIPTERVVSQKLQLFKIQKWLQKYVYNPAAMVDGKNEWTYKSCCGKTNASLGSAIT